MTFSPRAIFQRADRYDGVRPINIYLLRLLYILMFFVLGKQTWTHILTRQEPWNPTDAVVWCVWTAFATLAGLGIVRPLKMLPIIFLEIFYKVLWLLLVAYPLWSKGTLAGSPAEATTSAFLWVILPIVAVPWGYAFVNYIYKPKSKTIEGERKGTSSGKTRHLEESMETQGNVINLTETAAAVAGPYANLAVAYVNDHVVRMSVMTESFYWHRHPNSDETFLVLEGELLIDIGAKTVTLTRGEMTTVPKNVPHRTRPGRARSVNLTVELSALGTVRLDQPL